MRNIYLFMMVTLDGFFEGPKREIDWHNADNSEFNDFAVDQLNHTGMILFGRVTYEMMASYWPTPDAVRNDPVVAGRMNSLPKIVFSKTLSKAEWNNTRLVKENINEEILKLKKQSGGDIAIFGSSDLAVSLIRDGLIDEIRVIINPVVLGNGKSLFHGIGEKFKLKLLRTKVFQSGNVLLCYSALK
jgi:dihydrofolate reductase